MHLEEVGQKVSAEIDSYVYGYTDELIGKPLTPERIKIELDQLRSALVEPYWVNVVRRDTIEQIESPNPPICRCAVVAEHGEETLLAFDLAADEFLLARKSTGAVESYGVSGDAVGCFMAR